MRLSNPKVCDTNFFNYLEEPFTKEEMERIKNLCEIVEKAKEAVLSYDFISLIHKMHLLLIDLNTYVHSTEYWKNLQNKNYVSKIFCTVFEFIRIVSVLIKPILPELSLNITSFIGSDYSRVNLNYCWFRINENQFIDIYDQDSLTKIKECSNLKLFFDEINIREIGYFNVDQTFKDKIFINKVRIEKEADKKKQSKNNNKRVKK